MSNDSSGRGRDPKRPSRTIDLKATEVRSSKSRDTARAGGSSNDRGTSGSVPGNPATADVTGAAGPTSTAAALSASKRSEGQRTAASASSVPASRKSETSSTTAASPGDGGSAAAGGSGGGGNGGRGTGPGGSGSGRQEPEKVIIRERRGSGFLGLVTHLAAAIIGGGIVLYGAETIQTLGREAGVDFPEPTLPVPSSFAERVASLERTLEAQSGSGSDSGQEFASRLEQLERQVGEVEALRADVQSIRQDLQQAASATRESEASSPEGTEQLRDRVADIEQTLSALSSAAGAEGDSGGNRIGQLAALSGRLTDLEGTLQTQLQSMRQGILEEVDTMLQPVAEASAEARARGERLDREIAEIKTEAARLAQRAETLKANQERLDNAVMAAREEAGSLASDVTGLKGDFTQELSKVARPQDVAQAVAPVSEKVDQIEKTLSGVIENEAARRESAERILVALQLSNLKRALDRGNPYAAELQALQELAGDSLDLGALDRFKSQGIPTTAALLEDFRTLSFDIIRAVEQPEGGSWVDRLVSGAQSIVQVRRTGASNEINPNSIEGHVARIEAELAAGRIDAAGEAADALPAEAKAVAESWLAKLEARRAADRAIAHVEDELQESLTSNPAPPEKG